MEVPAETFLRKMQKSGPSPIVAPPTCPSLIWNSHASNFSSNRANLLPDIDFLESSVLRTPLRHQRMRLSCQPWPEQDFSLVQRGAKEHAMGLWNFHLVQLGLS
jgi:hypothetical protein